ncbi:type II secretion system GspH family protein [Tissierella carlieri]|uniref:Type II secretion system GspH family protein n=1 Tax=Tissierella carlieri TaxID=689904 RepID=A0ABT1S575_9FIRM|nr:type II secretion system GspH family protein [Tissierella carlieri]MCQ4921611.1 type II secretion system GspH family protein [Tissierella carlieri]
MGKKGFTLVETVLGLFLLGLIAVTVLPIINSSFIRLRNNKLRMEMIYIGEMSVEKIKAFDKDKASYDFIYDTDIVELIELFRAHNSVEVTIPKKESSEKYYLKIKKNQKSDLLWMISIFVYHNIEGSSVGHVEYNTYLPQK